MAENETVTVESDQPLSQTQATAIKVADKIATEILSNKPEVLAAIIGRRIRREAYDVIAQQAVSVLSALGARTHDVRRAIVCRVCNATLSSDTAREIKHDVMAKRPTNLTDEGRDRASEIRQIYDWNEEIDDTLLRLSSLLLHTKQPYAGKPNWGLIRQEMQRIFNIDFKVEQWRRRAQILRDKKSRESA